MIPILYDKFESVFTSNGLGRLPDCLTCTVPEERNGIFECDFTYPVGGINFEKLKPGQFVGVTHDNNGDVQPFKIVGYSKPIGGVVTFHAVHNSYALTKTLGSASGLTPVTSVSEALAVFENAVPTLPFRFLADFSASGYMPAVDIIPKPVRQLIGGMDGSFLDTYGGEIEWDRWSVIFHARRGQSRNFAIRYGVNMTDYTDDTSYQESYSSCIPYWVGGDERVVGNLVSSGEKTYDGLPAAVPLDLSGRFEDKPTKAQLDAEAAKYLAENRPQLPAQNITVDFVGLQDYGYADLGELMKCNLCDTLDVIFPAYGMRGTYKVVRTVWNVLADRYDEMELGSLKTTLSEALGITNTSGAVSSGGGGGTTGRGYFFGTCSTAAATAAKVVTCPEFTAADLTAGAVVFVDFTNSNTIASPTLDVNGTGAKGIRRYGSTAPSTAAASSWNAGAIVCLIYDGSFWIIEGWLNTTYSAISQTNIESLTSTGTGLITGQRLTQGVAKRVGVSQTLTSGTKIAEITINETATPLYAPAGGSSGVDYVTEEGTSGSWTYRKWSSGLQEAWFSGSITFSAAGSALNGWYRATQNTSLPLTFADDAVVQVTGASSGRIFTSGGIKTSGTQFEAQILSGASIGATTYSGWNVYVIGNART